MLTKEQKKSPYSSTFSKYDAYEVMIDGITAMELWIIAAWPWINIWTTKV